MSSSLLAVKGSKLKFLRREARWNNQNLAFNVQQDANMTFQVFDHDDFNDDLVGTGMINIGNYLQSRQESSCKFLGI